MTRAILPHDRPMTEAELRGFRMACACMVTWGTQLAAAAISTGGQPQAVPLVRLQEHRARFLVDVATALDMTIGQGRDRLPGRPSLPPARPVRLAG